MARLVGTIQIASIGVQANYARDTARREMTPSISIGRRLITFIFGELEMSPWHQRSSESPSNDG